MDGQDLDDCSVFDVLFYRTTSGLRLKVVSSSSACMQNARNGPASVSHATQWTWTDAILVFCEQGGSKPVLDPCIELCISE